MFRFKLGLAIGAGIGWLIGSGKAAELLERLRQSRSPEVVGVGDSTTGVYDFAVRAAQ
ncbi:MAG: hypothetical protein JWM12_3437 [Ilumatobacteraceae bacterium]|jgi:hypothetical protein|nr:hypothetical protein [Ilumatobacteraceae bacterium]